jgi:hypothetical protein
MHVAAVANHNQKERFYTRYSWANGKPLEFLVDASEDGQTANPQHCSLERKLKRRSPHRGP